MAEPAIPDLIQAVLGFRTWSVDAEGWLLPFSLGAIAGPWRPGANHAVCHYAKWRGDGTREQHAAPHARCMCGLYALVDLDDPRLPRHDPALALGAVAAWGDLEVHRSGFRAEFAAVVALAVAPGLPGHLRRRHERAAARYGVELVAPELLEVTGLRHAAPVPEVLLPAGPSGLPPAPGVAPGTPRAPRRGSRRRRARPAAPPVPAGRGVRVDDHVWLDATTLRAGITRAFAEHLGSGPVDLALPAAGTLHRTSDALARLTGAAGETLVAWTPLTATIAEVNPALADDPGRVLRDPEGAGWLATLVPHAWAQDAAGLEWGPRGAAAYRGALDRVDPWADLRSTAVRVRSAGEVLAELRRRRDAPRFPDADAVREHLVDPLRAALAAAPDRGARLARLGARVTFALHEPAAAFVLDARTDPAVVVEAVEPSPEGSGEPGDVVLRLTAETAERFVSGRLDVARSLRNGELVSDNPIGRTLSVVSVLTALPTIDVRPGTMRARGL
jgi:glycine cleavage system H lipoate-binding protein